MLVRVTSALALAPDFTARCWQGAGRLHCLKVQSVIDPQHRGHGGSNLDRNEVYALESELRIVGAPVFVMPVSRTVGPKLSRALWEQD